MRIFKQIENLLVAVSIVMSVLIFADGANVDDIFTKLTIVHSDMPTDDEDGGFTNYFNPDSFGQKELKTLSGPESLLLKHNLFDQDSPAINFATASESKVTFQSFGLDVILNSPDFLTTPLYILNRTLII